MINLTEKDKLEILMDKYHKNTILHRKFSNGSYYVKFCPEDEIFRELIGKEVFDIVGIKCPEYYYFQEKNCLISEDLGQLNGFMYMSEVPEIKKDVYWRRITLNIIKDSICKKVNNQDEILLELDIMHFIDILFSNIDRHLNNYGVLIDKNNNGHITVFDNGMFLDNLDCVTKPMACDSVTNKFPKYQECKKFLENLTEEHQKYIYELFLMFTPKTLKLIMKKIEKENKYRFYSKMKFLSLYTKNYIMIYSILLKTMNKNNKIQKLTK